MIQNVLMVKQGDFLCNGVDNNDTLISYVFPEKFTAIYMPNKYTKLLIEWVFK